MTIETVLSPVAHQEDNGLLDKTLYGEYWDRYADLLYKSILPELRGIMDDGQFNPQEFINNPNKVRQITMIWPGLEKAVVYLMITEGVTLDPWSEDYGPTTHEQRLGDICGPG